MATRQEPGPEGYYRYEAALGFPAESIYVKNVGEIEGRRLIKKYNLQVPEELIASPDTDIGLLLDKKNGTDGKLFFLPKSSSDVKGFTLNEGVISGRCNNAFLVGVYC